MFGAGAGLAPWLDFASFREVPPKALHVLIVDFADAIHAECADLASRARAAPAATKTARPAAVAAVAIGARARAARPEAARARIAIARRTGWGWPKISVCHGEHLLTIWSY
ncbi:hypothetical protein BH23CHL4_BH23CHL4_12310 [soil metagenome]